MSSGQIRPFSEMQKGDKFVKVVNFRPRVERVQKCVSYPHIPKLSFVTLTGSYFNSKQTKHTQETNYNKCPQKTESRLL